MRSGPLAGLRPYRSQHPHACHSGPGVLVRCGGVNPRPAPPRCPQVCGCSSAGPEVTEKANKFKGELIDLQAWPTRDLARRAIVVRGCTAPTDTAALPNRRIEQDQGGSVTKRSALSVKAERPHDAERGCRDANL
jgi:hypothetical protein